MKTHKTLLCSHSPNVVPPAPTPSAERIHSSAGLKGGGGGQKGHMPPPPPPKRPQSIPCPQKKNCF